jgi:hypothetical protein
MNDIAGLIGRKMQSEILAERVVATLTAATFADQGEARDAKRYAGRIEFAIGRVEELRAAADRTQSVFDDARLGVALTILEGHVVHAANFIDAIARRQKGQLSRVNHRIAGESVEVAEFEPIRTIRVA